jgi:hypothetical protein
MNILIFLSFILSTYGYQFPLFSKPCITCKHFLNINHGIHYSKCTKFPINYLITENTTKYFFYQKHEPKYAKIDFFYSHIVRKSDSMCGIDGKYYEKK